LSSPLSSNKKKANRYILLRLKIIYSLLSKGKVSLKKALNFLHVFLAFKLKRTKTARFPFMINFELWNECNENCVFCRSSEGLIYDQNPANDGSLPVSKGRMPFELFTDVIDQVKNHLFIAILYVNGEPLMYKRLFDAIRYAADRKVATLIATNGQLMTEAKAQGLLEAGLDYIKIAISGMTQETYAIQQRKGNVEEVKSNLRNLVRLNREGGYGLVVMLDFILYNYNAHQLDDVRTMCQELDVILSVRPGNLTKLDEEYPDLLAQENIRIPETPLPDLCEWPWQVLTIDWDGSVYPCCDYVVWNDVEPYAKIKAGEFDLAAIMNGEKATANRSVHLQEGRVGIPICAQCPRKGTAFKN